MYIKETGITAVICTVMILISFSCASTGDSTTEKTRITEYSTPIDFSTDGYLEHLLTPPHKNSPVFFAYVTRMSNREKEPAAALLNASEQASKYIAVKAVSKFYSEKVSSSFRYMSDLDIAWDRDLALEMIDRLEVISIIRDTYGTYLTAKLPDEVMRPVLWDSFSSGGTPGWTNTIPVIPGYIVSVGVALKSGYVADSFAASDAQALEDLSRQVSVEIVTGKKLIENSIGTISVQTNNETSEVIIPGFYILERWRTPDSHYYYSLAIAPEEIIETYRND